MTIFGLLRWLFVHNSSSSLVIREYQTIRNHDVFPPSRNKDHHFGDVIRREGVTPAKRLSASVLCGAE